MSNFFLLNEAMDLNNFDDFKLGISELASIEKCKEDTFFKHESIYNLPMIIELYNNFGYYEQEISRFIEQSLYPIENYFNTEKEFDNIYINEENAFLGIDFSSTNIAPVKQIINNDSYIKFNFESLWNVTFRNLWSKKEKLFPNLILCGEVQQQILKIGNSAHFNQIIERLKEFNSAIEDWKNGDFNHREINQKFALRISPESSQTMSKFGNERIFSLPTGGTEFFELHIKTGDLRFHFFPDNEKKKAFIGYIGSHLSTISN